jgi:hypothetical protein
MKTVGKNTNARFGFGQSAKKSEYFIKVFDNFKILCTPTTTPLLKHFTTNGTSLSSLSFFTMRLPCLNYYYELFYSTGKRQVPLNIIELLSPASLSYWIMDDGSKQNNGLHLNVYAFDEAGVQRLMETLQKKYSLTCTIHNHKMGLRIYIPQESMPTLRTIVKPYIIPSMLYKVGILINYIIYF